MCQSLQVAQSKEKQFQALKGKGNHLEFPRETGLMLRCPWKVGKAFQTKQVNRPYCHDQEGRRGSEEAVPGPSVFPSGEPGVSGRRGA